LLTISKDGARITKDMSSSVGSPLLPELNVLTISGDGTRWSNQDDVFGLFVGELYVDTVGFHDSRGPGVIGDEVSDRYRGSQRRLSSG